MALIALKPWTQVAQIKFLGKSLPTGMLENVTAANISQSLDAVTELTLTMIDPHFEALKSGYFQPKIPVTYADYDLAIASTETVSLGGREGVTIRCRPMIVQKLKERVGPLVMTNESPSNFIIREVNACGGVAVVQPLAARAQVSRDVPVQGEDYDSDNTPSSWTTFRRLANENGYLLFEQSGIIYFGKPSWFIQANAVGKLDIWWFEKDDGWRPTTIPICSRSVDSPEVTVDVKIPKIRAQDCRVGQKLVLHDIPTFKGSYVVSSVNYSILGQDGEVTVSAKTMKDKKATGVTNDQMNRWMNGESVTSGVASSTGVGWLDELIKQLNGVSSFNWASLLVPPSGAGGGGASGNKNAFQDFTPSGSWGTGAASSLNSVQLANASAIIKTTFSLGFSEKAAIIAIATAMQESTLGANSSIRKPNGDGDAGIFQQRTYKGWYGTLAQVNDVVYATTIFLKGKKLTSADVSGASNPAGPVGYVIPGLAQIKNWENMSVTRAAQAVQRSAYPDAYAKWETLARTLVSQFVSSMNSQKIGGGTSATGFTKTNRLTTPFKATGKMWSLGWHTGADFAGSTGDPAFAIASGKIISGNWGSSFGNHVILEVADGTRFGYCHLQRGIVSPGQTVKAGQTVGYIGATGNVSGPHLHIECRRAPYNWPNSNIDPMQWYNTAKSSGRSEATVPMGLSSSRSVREFVKLCLAQTGDAYVYGAVTSINDPNPNAFDCSELVQWAAGRVGISYTGTVASMYATSRRAGLTMSVAQATKTYGALLFRTGTNNSEHMAVSLGNGKTIEAVGKSYGVRQMNVAGRGFNAGGRIPGMVGYV